MKLNFSIIVRKVFESFWAFLRATIIAFRIGLFKVAYSFEVFLDENFLDQKLLTNQRSCIEMWLSLIVEKNTSKLKRVNQFEHQTDGLITKNYSKIFHF